MADHTSVPKGWMAAGSHPDKFDMGVETTALPEQERVGYLKALEPTDGFGTLMQHFNPTEFLGKRIRLEASVRSVDVSGWAGLWMRVDVNGKSDSFDNMQNRAIKGTTDWTRCSVVLDVSLKADTIALGILLDGSGRVWIKDIKFEVVDQNVPTTDLYPRVLADGPQNLGLT